MGLPEVANKSRQTLSVPLGVFSDAGFDKGSARATLAYTSRALSVPVPKLSGSSNGDPAGPPRPSAAALAAQPPESPGASSSPLTLGPEETWGAPEPDPASESPRVSALRALRGDDVPPRYDERELLGEGAMGEVRLAVDQNIGRTVAVKRLRSEASGLRASFVREAQIVGLLEHPNIVPLHDMVIDDDGSAFLVMKHLQGETLEDVIEKLQQGDPEHVERWSFEARIELFMGVLRALDYAHAKGVLHRDVKPANVMVGPHGEVVLMDWGIALRPGEVNAAGGRIEGTPYYMSPEHARGEALDARSDLYSASVLFHEFVVLEHYLEHLSDPLEVLAQVAQHGWRWSMMDWFKPRPQAMPPMELYHLIHKGMAFDRADRFASVREMEAELQRVLEGRVRVQCHLTLTKRVARGAGRFVDRRPWIAFGLLASTVVAAGYGALSALTQLLG